MNTGFKFRWREMAFKLNKSNQRTAGLSIDGSIHF